MRLVTSRLDHDLFVDFFPFNESSVMEEDTRICLLSIPGWMDLEWYNINQTKATYAYHFGLNPNTYEKDWFLKIFNFDLVKIYSIAELLKVKNFRSQFRSSLRMQLEDWLDESSNYKNPFSQKQWESLTKGNEIYGQLDLTFQANPFITKTYTLEQFRKEFVKE